MVREGYAALPAGDAQRLALESVWDESREAFMVRLIEESHCGKISPQLRDGLVRAQRLRDAVLADAVLPQIDRGVVFILGRGHARRDVGVLFLSWKPLAALRLIQVTRVEDTPGCRVAFSLLAGKSRDEIRKPLTPSRSAGRPFQPASA